MIPREQNKLFIKEMEGWEKKEYLCPAGFPSIGYGFNLKFIPPFITDNNLWRRGEELTLHIAEEWLDYLIDDVIVLLKTALPEFIYYEDYVQFVLIDMCYNLGIGKLLMFKNMLDAVNRYDNLRTVFEMENSKWFTQVPNRAKRLMSVISARNIQEALK